MTTALKHFSILAAITFAIALVSCSKQAQPQPPTQSRSMGLHLGPPPPGAESYVFMIILTNAQPPPMRSIITISKNMKYEWHKVADDGAESTIRGLVPTNIYIAVMAEWQAMSGRTSVDRTREQAAYVASVSAVHPPEVKSLLDYLSK